MLISTPCQSTANPWATVDDLCAPCNDYAIDTVSMNHHIQVASDILFELSGRRYPGIGQDTVRPCLRSLAVDYGRPIRPPWPFGGPYGTWGSGGLGSAAPTGFYMTNRSDRSGGQIVPEITLGAYPIVGIVEVKIDGQVLDPSKYRIDDNRWLVRLADPTTGDSPGWPGGQNMMLPPTEPDTWQVSFLYGVPPPPGGVTAAAVLACQLALACDPELVGKCSLPKRVTSLTRQGVSMVVIDPYDFLEKGHTGIYEVDLWLTSVNRYNLPRRSTVMSPDIRRRVRRAGTA